MNSLGELSPDPVGDILKTGFKRFQSPIGVDGLAKVRGRNVEILAVHASFEYRKGCFREFIKSLKLEFDSIKVIHIENPILQHALERYGFTRFEDVQSIEGHVEFITGMEWSSIVPNTMPPIC